MRIQQFLSKTPEQLKEYCKSLSDKNKQELYKQAIDEAKKKKTLNELNELNKLATAIEEVTGKKLLKSFDDDNPFKNEIAIMNFFKKLTKRLFLIMHSSTHDKNLEELNELDKLLPEIYKELSPRLTDSMRNYVLKELKSSNFLRDNIDIFKFLEETKHGSAEERKKATIDLIRLVALQPEMNYQADIFILTIIADNIKIFRKEAKKLKYDLSTLINLLEEHVERLEDLECEIETFVKEDSSVKFNIEKNMNEVKETEEKIMSKRDKVLEQLFEFRLKFLTLQ